MLYPLSFIIMQTILDIKNISKNFKAVRALNNISLQINKGEIFGLLGPDGAGKSTLIYIASGLLGAKSGSATLLNNNMLTNPEKIKTSIGVLPQGLGLSLAAELSVEENIDYFAEINAVPPDVREKRKANLLKATGLLSFRDRPAKNLSGGMKQKLGICCTLIHSPKMIFLDEPTTGVDPISRRDIWYLINKTVKEQDITILLTTSYMDEAERCHRIALMHEGSILANGNMDELTKELPGKLLEIQTDDQQKMLTVIKKMDEIKTAYTVGDKINAVYTAADDKILSVKNYAAKNDLKIKQINKITPTLEDIFLSKIMTKESGANLSALEEFFGKNAKINDEKTNNSSIIEVKNLYKYFGKFAAVSDVTFDVKRGEIFGFLGPNGAGKTTTIKMLCGLFPPSSGSGKIHSFDIMKQQWDIKKNIGYMSQKFSLYRDLTVGENIELYAGIYGVPRGEVAKRKELILKIADLVGQGSTITDSLPMGIKQRLALGCAIIHKPEVIFLDEPTSGVDPIARRIFWDIIFFLSRNIKVTVLVTTHYMDEAEQCDRLSLMHMGKLIALGTPADLKRDVAEQTGKMLEILVDKPFDALDILSKQLHFCNIFGRTIHLYTKEPETDFKKIQKLFKENNISLMDVREKLIPFEDVFVYFCENAEKAAISV